MATSNNKKQLSYKILLKTTDNAVKFVQTINNLEGYFDICMGSYFFDAKSILGVLSMDPARTMELRIIRNDNLTEEELDSALEPFIAWYFNIFTNSSLEL